MNPKQVIPALAKLAPVLAAAAPPVLIGAAIGGAILWLLSSDNKSAAVEAPQPAPDVPHPAPVTAPATVPVVALNPPSQAKRIRREDLAMVLEYGARCLTRQEAVTALQALGFRKTAAYKALSTEGRFAAMINTTEDGLVEWVG